MESNFNTPCWHWIHHENSGEQVYMVEFEADMGMGMWRSKNQLNRIHKGTAKCVHLNQLHSCRLDQYPESCLLCWPTNTKKMKWLSKREMERLWVIISLQIISQSTKHNIIDNVWWISVVARKLLMKLPKWYLFTQLWVSRGKETGTSDKTKEC